MPIEIERLKESHNRNLAIQDQRAIEAILRETTHTTWDRSFHIVLDGQYCLLDYVCRLDLSYNPIFKMKGSIRTWKIVPSNDVIKHACMLAYFNCSHCQVLKKFIKKT